MRKSPFLYPRQAEAHEALFVRVRALLDQLKPLAAKHPDGPVSPVAVRLATEMLGAVAWLVGEKGAGCVPAADLAGLMAQLSEARAKLEHFEAQHSACNEAISSGRSRPRSGSHCRYAAGGVPRPARLMPPAPRWPGLRGAGCGWCCRARTYAAAAAPSVAPASADASCSWKTSTRSAGSLTPGAPKWARRYWMVWGQPSM
mgnify:CR=1 FL=1